MRGTGATAILSCEPPPPLDHVPDPKPGILDFARLETELYDAVSIERRTES